MLIETRIEYDCPACCGTHDQTVGMNPFANPMWVAPLTCPQDNRFGAFAGAT